MDHDQRTMQAEQQDTALAATIVKAIPELERDYRLAEGPLSERLMREVQASMRKAAPEPWEVTDSQWSVLLRSPEWKPTRGLGNGDAWLEISEIAEDEIDHTWIGAAVGAGRSQMGLELKFRNGLSEAAGAVARDKVQASALEKIGFRKDESATRWLIPIAIDRLRLAKGYGENDLTEALGPVTKAVEAVVAAKTDLDALIEAVRTKAKAR
jgi:hypothetical protein